MRPRRILLAALACAVLGAPLAPGCAAPFDPPSKVSSLRVFAVTADKPYAAPGDTVSFTMTYHDGLGDETRPVQVVWLGGCFDPEGDEYFQCYEQLAEVFEDVTSPTPGELFGVGLEFQLTLPEDIVSRRPVPKVGPHYGIAYVFFAACAGRLGIVPPEGTGNAGSFPLGCFDPEGNRLGSESFVPGYTQIYSFADGRVNANPVATGIAMGDHAGIEEDLTTLTPIPEDEIPTVKACPLTEDERRLQGCGAEDPFTTCDAYDLKVIVEPPPGAPPGASGEVDPEGTSADGDPLTESVWVDFYIDGGDLDSDVKLVNDPVAGTIDQTNPRAGRVTWIPPDHAGLVTLWAVVHDARGGTAVVQRLIRVE